MSKRSTRNRNTITLDRREITRMIEAEVARRYTPPAGANVTPIPQNIIDTMMQQQAPQSKTGGMWEPGTPIKPIPGLAPPEGPRQWSYQVGSNIGFVPRSTEMTSFDTLRNLAKLYEIIPMCMQVWYDLAGKLKLRIKPRQEATVDAKGEPIEQGALLARYGARIERWTQFFKKPDPGNGQKLDAWMQMILKDRLEIDAVAIFKHKDRIGRLYGLEVINGATIKPLLNERGRKPDGDFPAYLQVIHGAPAMFLRRDELMYLREIEQTDSPYGFSRVEYIIMRVNQALRKENKDLSYFTDGNVPAGFFSPAEDGTTDWTPEQLLMYQQIWDGAVAGNDSVRSRSRWVPPGTTYTKTEIDDILVVFDEYITTVTCGAFGVPKTELSFTEKSNRSTGETQEAVIYRRPLASIMKLFSGIMNDVMEEEGDTDLEATWEGWEEPEDLKTKAEAWNILVTNGTQSTSQAAAGLGLKPMLETEPFVITKDGPVFIKDVMDLRETTMQAKKAGLQQSIDNPGGMQNEQGTQQGQQGAQGAMGGKQGQSGGGKQGNSNGAGKQGQNDSGNGGGATVRSIETSLPGQSNDAERAERGIDAQATQVQAAADSRQSAQGTGTLLPHAQGQGNQGNPEHDALLRSEYRRWRECAIKDVKAGGIPREFVTSLIPVESRRRILTGFAHCENVEDIKRVFELERARQTAWEPPDVEDQLGILQRAEVATVTWQDAPGACSEICLENAGVTVKLGERFPGGQRVVVGHPHCQCQPIYHKVDGQQISVSTGQEVEI